MPEEPTTPPAAPVKAALLDADGYFVRMDETAELTPRHLPQIDACDLPPGQYRWDGTTFVHAPRALPQDFDLPPHAERAIVKGFEAVLAAGIPLPDETVRYVEHFRRTVDAVQYATPQAEA